MSNEENEALGDKRAQVSFFLIIAVVVILGAGLIIALRLPFLKSPQLPDLPPKVEPVIEFVQQCLMDSTLNGLILLGKQGGVIYESQGGTVPDSFKTEDFALDYGGRWIWYSIFPGTLTYGLSCCPRDIGTDLFSYERCPSITFPFEGENSEIIAFGPEVGDSMAHDLSGNMVSNARMLNQLNLPGLYENEGVARQVGWIQPLMSPKMKIRASLAEFIARNITKCLNFEELRKKGLVVKRIGNLSVNPTFSEEFTSVEMMCPLTVQNNVTESGKSTLLNKFSISSRVRFGKIYKYVNDILRKEAEDYSYNLSSTVSSENISLINLIRDVDEKKVDVVVFEDNQSWIPKQNQAEYETYRFFAAIPNSPPSAAYIHYRNLSAVPGLKSYLNLPNCGGVFDTPLNVLSARVFKQMNRQAVACIFNAYKNSTGAQGNYRPAYDPDDDPIDWDFKTSNCDWGQACEYNNESEFDNGMQTTLSLKFFERDNPNYNDTVVVPIKLFNSPPSNVRVSCTGEDPVSGWFVYKVETTNLEDSYKDPLNLTLDFHGPTLDYNIGTRYTTGITHWWNVWFTNNTGVYNITFSVTDSFGASNSTNARVVIPC